MNKLLMRSAMASALASAICMAQPAAAAQRGVDCPLRDAPFSISTPMMDLAMNDAARGLVRQAVPGFDRMPAMMTATTAPAFSAIMNVRTLIGFGGQAADPQMLAALDAKLRAIPVTAADKAARCARYDTEKPSLAVNPAAPVKVLLFEKMTGFRDGPSVDAAKAMIADLAAANGWSVAVTDKGGAIAPDVLRRFDVVIWNNISGDVLTLTQRRALQQWMERGGGFVALHGSGGDFIYFWDWYADNLIGARFIGHPMSPQFQPARVAMESPASGIGASLRPGWTMTDEWYSFARSPRLSGAHVVATLDESSYSPVGRGGQELRMGADHPIAWTRCVASGRSFYSAIGHRPDAYANPQHRQLIADAIGWAAGKGATQCRDGREVPSSK